jgi:hypothetical protein
MGEPAAMRTNRSTHRNSAITALVSALAIPGLAGFPQPRAFANDNSSAATSFAQADVTPLPRRVPHIRVRPLAQTHPGPNAVRQCVSWIAPEYRPSGTVIVPRMHCWWEG